MTLNEVGKCNKHPYCKAWVKVEGKKICYECWNQDTRHPEEKRIEIKGRLNNDKAGA